MHERNNIILHKVVCSADIARSMRLWTTFERSNKIVPSLIMKNLCSKQCIICRSSTNIIFVFKQSRTIKSQFTFQFILCFSFGGIVPPIAQAMHRENITAVCEKALRSANMRLCDIDAVATTVKPGLELSLMIGAGFGKYLAKVGRKPFIPIHHMEAHALTARMVEKVQ